MKITLFAAGSRGDIQPCIAVGKGLQNAGYQVRIAAPQDFGDWISSHNIDFHPLTGDVQKIMAGDTGREFMESGGRNPFKSIAAMRTMLEPVVSQMTDDAYLACRDADGLICLGVLSAFGQAIAESLEIPLIHIEPTPLLPSRNFPAPAWPIQHNLGGWHNFFSGWLMLRVVWLWYSPFVNDFRKRLGLKSVRYADMYRALQTTPMISAYSPQIMPHANDWPAHIHITGYAFLDPTSDWQPSKELDQFLSAGTPPVYFGFGSMAGRNPEKLAETILSALAMSGQRGVLLTGWGGLQIENIPENVFVLDSAPHGWLFPRVAAVVHHGGAGTTAEGLRAGVPSIIVPFAFDQSFWGTRIAKLGLGPTPIPQKKLSAARLAEAIGEAVTNKDMLQKAAAVGKSIRGEMGINHAVKVVKKYFGSPG